MGLSHDIEGEAGNANIAHVALEARRACVDDAHRSRLDRTIPPAAASMHYCVGRQMGGPSSAQGAVKSATGTLRHS
jgi:hypothetical protein